jgi:N-acetyl sugar amidotransferase
MKDNIHECSKCILSTADYPEMVFDNEGVCSICGIYDKNIQDAKLNDFEKNIKLENLILKIKTKGKNKKYDCLIGVSGGVDSSYLAIQAKKWGLRPLLLHVDNGWNSELAVNNIETLLNKLDYNLFTYVVKWDEVRDVVLSYLKASVIDIDIANEMPSQAMLYKTASKFNVKYILTGHNYSTEGWLPPNVSHFKIDTINLNAIHRRFGTIKLKTYPKIGVFRTFFYKRVKKIEYLSPLDYIDFNKEEAKKLLLEEYGWRDYGGKHFENIFTRFYQGFILPKKFKVDKRKFHLSTLICSGQLSKSEALIEIAKPPYPYEGMLADDKAFVLKKLNLTEQEFSAFMNKNPVRHTHYPSYMNVYLKLKPLKKLYNRVFKTN